MPEQRPIETAEITVQYVNPPKEGKKWGNVKSSAGDVYFGPPPVLAHFKAGETCRLEYELGGNDGTLKSIRRKLTAPGLQPPKVNERPHTPKAEAHQMATMGMVNNFIGAGMIPLDEQAIADCINKCSNAFSRSVLSGRLASRRDDMGGEEIPY